jgi:hypothetical protein
MRTRPQEGDDARRHCLLPPPALRERRHRGLARCRVTVCRRAVFVDSLESNRLEHVGEIECESFLATQPERIP